MGLITLVASPREITLLVQLILNCTASHGIMTIGAKLEQYLAGMGFCSFNSPTLVYKIIP